MTMYPLTDSENESIDWSDYSDDEVIEVQSPEKIVDVVDLTDE